MTDKNELNNELRIAIGAHMPCLAIQSPETDEIIFDVVQHACVTHDVTPLVMVWRVSAGFEEYAGYIQNDDEEEVVITSKVSPQVSGIDIRKTGRVEASEEDFPGCQVPFAVNYMTNYDPTTEGRMAIFILRDWHNYIDSNAEFIDQQLNLFENILHGDDKTILMLNPSRWNGDTVPKELSEFIRVVDFPLPDKETRIDIIETNRTRMATDGALVPEANALFRNYSDDELETFADACAGLTRQAIEDVLTMCVVEKGKWEVGFILDEKIKNVERAGFTLIRPTSGFENIGGLTPLKEWVTLISKRFTNAAREYGFIRNVRGLLMAGVPGCGKTAIAKATAKEMNMNLLMVDATDLKGSLVGESEAKVHRLLEIAKAAAPLIVFVDEAEKLLGKAEGIHDGGAHDAVLGQFLTFMQEDDSGVFFVFTANNMNKFAPELIDRFEGRFFIDLPEPEEREEIIKIHLGLRRQELPESDTKDLVKLTANFSGRNIEDGIEEAMTRSFDEDRPLEMKDLTSVFDVLVPTSKTKKEEIEIMRSFVDNGSMRRANDVQKAAPARSRKGSSRITTVSTPDSIEQTEFA